MIIDDKIKTAIERIKMASTMSEQYYYKPLTCAYSGGKDSEVILELFKMSGIRFQVHNSHTTVDAPQTVYHIRKKFAQLEMQGVKCDIEMPTYRGEPVTMWSLIPIKKMPPTRLARYCCSVLKETGCKNSFIATGVRWDESRARQERNEFETITSNQKKSTKISTEIMLLNDNSDKRKLIEHCQLKAKSVVNPIIDWGNKDVWEVLRGDNIEYNPLYDMGYSRVGCVGCPMAGKNRYKEFADFPTYKRAYINAFERMLVELRNKNSKIEWKTGQDVFNWWMEDKNLEGQLSLFEDQIR